MSPNIGNSYAKSIGRSYATRIQNASVRKNTDRTVWERVKEALNDAGMPPTQAYAAKLLGIRQPSVAEWNQPRGAPTIDNAIALGLRLNVSVDWIYTGREPKRPGPPDDPIAQELWDVWGRLEEAHKQQLLGYARLSAHPTPPKRTATTRS
jgi:DNA-binding XRE family transcriptional regulator